MRQEVRGRNRRGRSPGNGQLALFLLDEAGISPVPATVPAISRRYCDVNTRKASGSTYTPLALAEYLATRLMEESSSILVQPTVNILDPALGDGVLVDTLLEAIEAHTKAKVRVTAFETDRTAIERASALLARRHPQVVFDLRHGDFLHGLSDSGTSTSQLQNSFDLIIANPPYVRTQVLGANEAQALAVRFDLEGRVDLYHAFLWGMVFALRPGGMLGVITSNRFMTTRGAGALRSFLDSHLQLRRVWDLGDTRLFDAAVLPALLVGMKAGSSYSNRKAPLFTSIYETTSADGAKAMPDVVAVLDLEGVFKTDDGRTFAVKQGELDSGDASRGIWRLSTTNVRTWLNQVSAHTWAPFRELGKVRVGVKTTADRVFISDDWSRLTNDDEPELLRPLITHHIAERYRARAPIKHIIYPHLIRNGVRVVADLKDYPRTAKYLEQHRPTLEARTYVIEAGRRWYEIWVPQDPSAWPRSKLVFRDICERPTFWVDEDGNVVNGDCYWLTCERPNSDDLLWLAAAVSNSTFIEQFYDNKFNNKLYAGRRRFITQYVEKFPLPDPASDLGREIIRLAKSRGSRIAPSAHEAMEKEIDLLVWRAFGFSSPTSE